MNLFKISLLTIAIVLLSSCSKEDEPAKTYAKPDWALTSVDQLSSSLTAIVRIPSNISIYGSDEDMLAAFIGDECRGIGYMVENEPSNKEVYYITIRGTSSESEEVTFKYYNASLSYLYHATNTVVFESDANYGTYDAPVVFELIQQ